VSSRQQPPRPEPQGGPLPLKTPLRDFSPYVPASALKELTARAARLTKQDLLLLDAGEFTPATRKLTVEDLHSLRTVFAQTSTRRAKAPQGGIGHYCCCCCCYFCCCCTAVSVTRPLLPAVAGSRTAPVSSRALG
jgi:hypothetical protein